MFITYSLSRQSVIYRQKKFNIISHRMPWKYNSRLEWWEHFLWTQTSQKRYI